MMILNSTMSLYTEENLMTDNSTKDLMNVENFKEYVLNLERDNLKNINKEDKKAMVSKIIRTYEEGKKDGNK